MTRFSKLSLILVLLGLAGCHLTGPKSSEPGGKLPADLGEGHGRVDKTYTASLGQSIRATLDVLDELNVKPLDGSIRANDAASPLGKQKWVGQSNAEYLPDDVSFHDLFDRQRLNLPSGETTGFAPILMAYKGEIQDGKSVMVIIRSQPPDATRTQIMARVGRDGDEAWSRSFFDKITAHLPQAAPAPPADLPALPATP